MSDEDLNARVQEALERTPIMALSTVGPDGSWTSPVQFAYNEKLELSLGLQLRGTAHHLGEVSDGWQHFTIRPEEVWCFDSRVYGNERRRVNLSRLSLAGNGS
jgi:hypothetical protein